MKTFMAPKAEVKVFLPDNVIASSTEVTTEDPMDSWTWRLSENGSNNCIS